jgi:hypothetical protein
MGFGVIQVAAAGFVLLLALAVVWLACRLKRKNQQLRRALAELQRRAKEPAPASTTARPSPTPPDTVDQTAIADAFLWQHLGGAFQTDSRSLPTGMCQPAALQPLLEMGLPFTGLVVLVGIEKTRMTRQEFPAQPFIEGILGPSDFACHNSDDEFLIVCPGLREAEAQRRLNEISDQLRNFQSLGQGSLSVLFGWGGIGAEDEPLSEAIASATERMEQVMRSRGHAGKLGTLRAHFSTPSSFTDRRCVPGFRHVA